MTSSPTILAFSGSLRRESWNTTLVRAAARAAEQAGGNVTVVELRDHPLPLYDQDLESSGGLPEPAVVLKDLFSSHDGLLIASPEHNSSITAALKNTIDWVSRPREGERPLACFAGKVAGLMSASPGALGGLRGLVHLRAILMNIQVMVLPDQQAIARAHEAFTDDGVLKDEGQQKRIGQIATRVVETVRRLKV